MTHVKNFSQMLVKSIALLTLVAFTFSSCKKDKDATVVPPASPIAGKWGGVLTTEGAPDGSLNIVIKLNGTLEVMNTAGVKTADGTWQLGGSAGVTFTCSFTTNAATPQKYNLMGSLVTPTKINGSWGTGSSHFNGGFFDMTKE